MSGVCVGTPSDLRVRALTGIYICSRRQLRRYFQGEREEIPLVTHLPRVTRPPKLHAICILLHREGLDPVITQNGSNIIRRFYSSFRMLTSNAPPARVNVVHELRALEKTRYEAGGQCTTVCKLWGQSVPIHIAHSEGPLVRNR